MVGISEDVRKEIFSVTGSQWGSLSLKYLGVLVKPIKFTKNDCQPWIERISPKIRG